MGTSGSFNGSSDKNAIGLRDNISEWLDGVSTSETESPEGSPIIKPETLFPAVRIIADGFHSSQSSGTKRTQGGGSSRSTGRSSSKTAGIAGKAGGLALAYTRGQQDILEQAGLDYNELKSLGDSVSISSRIVDSVFPKLPDSSIGDSEARTIAAKVVSWVINESVNREVTPEEIVRKAIETNIAEVALTEVTAKINDSSASVEDKNALEKEIRQSSVYLASQAKLTSTGATAEEITQAIEEGIQSLVYIYGGEN